MSLIEKYEAWAKYPEKYTTEEALNEIVADLKWLEESKLNTPISLPNNIELNALADLLKYSDKYEIFIQFTPDQIAVFIGKDDVNLQDFGGDFEYAIGRSVRYLNRITGKKL